MKCCAPRICIEARGSAEAYGSEAYDGEALNAAQSRSSREPPKPRELLSVREPPQKTTPRHAVALCFLSGVYRNAQPAVAAEAAAGALAAP